MTEINTYGKLTVEIIEKIINQEIDNQKQQVDRFMNPNDAHHANLLHEDMLRLDTLINFKRHLSNHDLNIRCRDGA